MSGAARHPAHRWALVKPSVLPGFRMTLTAMLVYLGLIVVLPLAAAVYKAATLSPAAFLGAVGNARVLAAFRLSFGAALGAAAVNAVFGLVVAWVLVRYPFPGRRLVDALVDLPFALPTAVAGIALAAVFATDGWLGAPLASLGIDVDFKPLGVVVALVFIGLPFVVRTVEPVLEELDQELEEAAHALGASPAQTFVRVVLPTLSPALLTGFTLAFARAVGEYGSVIFIAGNVPFVSEIVPLVIVTKLEEYDEAGAAAVGVVMLAASFALIFLINLLQGWMRRRYAQEGAIA